MDGRRRTGRFRFWLPALLWLPGGIIADEVLRTGSAEQVMTPSSLMELPAVAPFGLPLALACRRLGRLGYPGPALVAWLALGAASVAGLLVPLPVGVRAVLVCLPVWLAAWRLARLPRGPGIRPFVTAAGAREVSRAVSSLVLRPLAETSATGRLPPAKSPPAGILTPWGRLRSSGRQTLSPRSRIRPPPAAGRRHVPGVPTALTPRQSESQSRERLR